MSASSSLVVMLARQRTGTDALRSTLDAHPELFCTPEIFHPEPSPDAHLEVEANYFGFLERHTEGALTRVLTSLEEQEQLFLDYLEYVRCFSDKRYVLLDVKYNSTHIVDGPWREVTREPELFLFIRRHGLRVLNLTRRNYLRYYLSWRKGNLADGGTSQARADSDSALVVPVGDVMFHLELCRSESESIARSFAEYPLYVEFEYDDLFPALNEPPSKEEVRRLSAWLALEGGFPSAPPKQPAQPVRGLDEAIVNYDEVADALRGTPYEYCLDDERAYRRKPAATSRRSRSVKPT